MSECRIVQAWVDSGHVNLAELEEHVKGCPVCQGIVSEIEQDIRKALEEGDDL